MNACVSFFIGMTIACECASMQLPGPPIPQQIPQPVAPSTLPYETYRYGNDDPYGIDNDRYEYDTRGPCLSQNASGETSESIGSNEDTALNPIDWCALAPYRPRYAPQIPASWWWHHRTPWRYWRTR